MRLNLLFDNYGSRKTSKRVGRGLGSGKGKTCGKGYKGQKARAGVAIKGFEGGQMALIHRLPKRGFSNIFRVDNNVVNLGTIQSLIDNKVIDAKNEINKEVLLDLGVISDHNAPVKLLAKGDFSSKITIEVDLISKAALEILQKNGSKVTITSEAK